MGRPQGGRSTESRPPGGFSMSGVAAVLASIWKAAGLPEEALSQAQLPGSGPVLPSSFDVATAAQTGIAAAALAAAELWWLRHGGDRQTVTVDRSHATLECTGPLWIDGVAPPAWDPLSGLYPCGDALGMPGWVRIHANFAHHRDRALTLLGCAAGAATPREAVRQALRHWTAGAFESAADEAGAVVAAARTFDAWDRHPQARALASEALVEIERIGDAAPLPWPAVPADAHALSGLKVLELSRILAGPVAGRTLAVHGAEVLLINGPHLPNIAALADTSRGKRSALLDLREAEGRARLAALVAQSHVFLQAYRPGALAARGFSAGQLAHLRPGIVVASLSAYGHRGPWADRRGFDSLVQTATGFNLAEAQAAGASEPRALPMQVLDYAAGHLLAFGTQAALWRQQTEGGSWQVRVSLAGVGQWLRGLPREAEGLAVQRPPVDAWLETVDSGFGRLQVMRHAAQMSRTPPAWHLPSMPPGSHPPAFG
jgi:CoA-transferase family III